MKKSKYNIFIKDNDKTLCFNGLSGKVFSVENEELKIIQGVLNSEKAQKMNVPLTMWLADNHFLEDENIDEKEQLLKKNRSEVFDDSYQLILNPTLECNFRCWYCYEQHPEGHMSSLTMEKIKKYVNGLIEKDKIKDFSLGWFGGEPLLYFEEIVYPLSLHFKKIFSALDIPYSCNMTTNGYYIDREMINKFDEIDLRHFQITLDGDRETHNRTRNQQGEPSFDKILQNIVDLCSYLPKCDLLLRINFTNEIIAKDYKVILAPIPQQIRSQIKIHFQRVWQTAGNSENCRNDLIRNISNLRDVGFSVTPNNFYSFNRSHKCYADRYNYAHINYDGKVYKCTARNYSDVNSVGELEEEGLIKWKSGILEMMYAKPNFDNKECIKCKLLPMCGGPCLQHKLDVNNGISKKNCNGKAKEIDIKSFIREYYLCVKKNHQMKLVR
ncbi:MAG: radical SAM protein [Tannerella sp.]|jgi:uncharacterized protein|nr:radical SAM protein [Tannerella sp.]